jgi:tetratricopeptide (TPR) repeat protein
MRLLFISSTFFFILLISEAVMSQHAALPDFIKMWNFNDPAATEQQFKSVLPVAERSGNSSYLAELLSQIARTHSLRGNFNKAHEILDRVEKLLTPEMVKPRMRYLLERGRSFNSSGSPEKAMPLFVQAYELGKGTAELSLTIDAVHMVAIAESDKQKRIEWNLKGVAMAEADSSGRGWLWALLNNLGECYLDVADYPKAVETFERLADFQRERGGQADMYTHIQSLQTQ